MSADLPGRPANLRPRAIALVAAGGAAGTAARIGVGEALPVHPGQWPWATFAVNLAGAFLLGVLLEAIGRGAGGTRLRLLLGTGFCGAFTTYSALAAETDGLLRAGRPGLAAGYALGSVAAGLLTAAAGVVLAARVRR